MNERDKLAAQRLVRNHPYRRPRRATKRVAELVVVDATKRAKELTPVRTGKLRRTLRAIVRERSDVIEMVIRAIWYITPVNWRTEFVTKNIENDRVIREMRKRFRELE